MRSNRNRLTVFLCSLILGVLGSHHGIHADSLHLTWSVSSQDQDGFEIERRPVDSGVFSFIAIVPPHQTWYTDYYLADNTTYCYRVRAYSRVGASSYSDEFCATTLAADQGLKTISTNISEGTVLSGSSVVWTAVPTGTPMRVEFLIDDTVSAMELISPYRFNGKPLGTLDTNKLTNGSHQLKVRAIYANNLTTERTFVVTVSNPSTN